MTAPTVSPKDREEARERLRQFAELLEEKAEWFDTRSPLLAETEAHRRLASAIRIVLEGR